MNFFLSDQTVCIFSNKSAYSLVALEENEGKTMRILFVLILLLVGCSAPVAQAPAQQGSNQPQGWVETTPTGAVMSWTRLSDQKTIQVSWMGNREISVVVVNVSGPRKLTLPMEYYLKVEEGLECMMVGTASVQPKCRYDGRFKRNY